MGLDPQRVIDHYAHRLNLATGENILLQLRLEDMTEERNALQRSLDDIAESNNE